MKFKLVVKIFITCWVLAFISGCTSLAPVNQLHVNSFEKLKEHIKTGDHVVITTADNQTHSLIVRSIDPVYISSNSDKIEISTITKIDKKELEAGKTMRLSFTAWVVLSVIALTCCFVVA